MYSASASPTVNRWHLDEGAGSSSCSSSSSSVMHSRTFAAVCCNDVVWNCSFVGCIGRLCNILLELLSVNF